jgi:hypothetical protein
MFKKYNDENFQNVIKSLKGLPQIFAPDDLEINIKRGLNALEYKPLPKRVLYHQASRTLIPAFGLSVAIFLFFLVISNQNNPDINNPFNKLPALRTVNTNKSLTGNQERQMKITENDVVLEERQPDKPVNLFKNESFNEARRTVVDKRSRYIDLITSTTDADNVDKSLKARPNNGMDENNVGSTVNFNGFNIIQDEDQTMAILRARMDSLKKVNKEKK